MDHQMAQLMTVLNAVDVEETEDRVYFKIGERKQELFNGFPLVIVLETSSYCNLECLACPYKDLTRPNMFMDPQLFKKLVDEILSCTNGHAFMTEQLIKKYKETGDVEKALSSFFKDKNSLVYSHLEKSLDNALNRARGQALLKTILNVLSCSEPLTLSEIARKIYRSAPVTKSLLERLIKVDLVVKKDSKFMFSDPALRLWLASSKEAVL